MSPSPPLFVPGPLNERLWHLAFNRVNDPITEQLVRGREDIFFGYEFAIQGGQVPQAAIDYYVRGLSSPGALSGSFGFYRSWDETMAQNGGHAHRPSCVATIYSDDGGIDISTSTEAALEMDSAPSDPTTASTVLVSLFARTCSITAITSSSMSSPWLE